MEVAHAMRRPMLCHVLNPFMLRPCEQGEKVANILTVQKGKTNAEQEVTVELVDEEK
jgi:hypothetical protein